MSALFPKPMTAQRERVDITSDGVSRFSRTLSDRNPHVRSSTAVIVPMDDTFHPADLLVMRASVFGLLFVIALLLWEWLA